MVTLPATPPPVPSPPGPPAAPFAPLPQTPTADPHLPSAHHAAPPYGRWFALVAAAVFCITPDFSLDSCSKKEAPLDGGSPLSRAGAPCLSVVSTRSLLMAVVSRWPCADATIRFPTFAFAGLPRFRGSRFSPLDCMICL